MKGNKENTYFGNQSDDSDLESECVHQYPLKQKGTVECSIQVNMRDLADCLPPSQKKKMKRKEYKKRKRQKGIDQERSAKIDLEKIISKIYRHETTYEKEKIKVQNCVVTLKGGQKFHDFLNQVIRLHVQNIQKQIWEYTQQILHENVFQNDSSHDFYLHMVRKIYDEYASIKISSIQIQRIINCYMRLTSNNFSQEKQVYRYLDRSTFNYLIQSDETLKNLIRICDKKVTEKHRQERFSLNKIIDIISQLDNAEQMSEDYDDQDDEDCEDFGERSTSVSEEEIQKNNALERKKNKRRKRLKQEEMKSQFQDVMLRLNEFSIDQDQRKPCAIADQWLENLEKSVLTTLLRSEGS